MQPNAQQENMSSEEPEPSLPPSSSEMTSQPKSILTNLLCEEIMELEEAISCFDINLLSHGKMFGRLKDLEIYPKYNYYKGEILPYMRKVVASWMQEVCEEQQCEESVFPLAVCLLDKLLMTVAIKKENLQMVACICLLISSKTRMTKHFSLELLQWYTDGSVRIEELRTWELAILQHLRWDVNVITPMDFVDISLFKLLGKGGDSVELELIRRHAVTFVSLCCTDPRFVSTTPSMVSSACIYIALKGLNRKSENVIEALAVHTANDVQSLKMVVANIEAVIKTELEAVKQTMDVNLYKNKQVGGTVTLTTSAGQGSPCDIADVPV